MTPTLAAGSPQLIINAQSAAAFSGILWLGGLSKLTTIVLQGNGVTSSGVITIEEAYYPIADQPYTGTWSGITTINASTLTGGQQGAIHLVNWSIWALRIRISTVIGGGGTISATAWAV